MWTLSASQKHQRRRTAQLHRVHLEFCEMKLGRGEFESECACKFCVLWLYVVFIFSFTWWDYLWVWIQPCKKEVMKECSGNWPMTLGYLDWWGGASCLPTWPLKRDGGGGLELSFGCERLPGAQFSDLVWIFPREMKKQQWVCFPQRTP